MTEVPQEFIHGLRPDEVIPHAGPRRALSISEALFLRAWWDRRRKARADG